MIDLKEKKVMMVIDKGDGEIAPEIHGIRTEAVDSLEVVVLVERHQQTPGIAMDAEILEIVLISVEDEMEDKMGLTEIEGLIISIETEDHLENSIARDDGAIMIEVNALMMSEKMIEGTTQEDLLRLKEIDEM